MALGSPLLRDDRDPGRSVTSRQRTRARLVIAGAMLVAAGLTAMMLIHTEAEPPSHPGTATATVVSADSRIEATIYRIDPLTSFGPMTEVTLGLTAAGIAHDEVTLGCTEDDDGLSIVEVRFITADTLMLRNYNGDEQTIKFNPQTLQPASTIGHC